MTKRQEGVVRVGLPIAIVVAGLIGLGAHQQKIKTNEAEIEKKVDVAVYETDRKADKREHDRMIEQLDTIETDVKELLKK